MDAEFSARFIEGANTTNYTLSRISNTDTVGVTTTFTSNIYGAWSSYSIDTPGANTGSWDAATSTFTISPGIAGSNKYFRLHWQIADAPQDDITNFQYSRFSFNKIGNFD